MAPFRRLVPAVVACGLLASAAPPAAAFSYSCAYDSSTRLLTAQDRTVRVWVQEGAYGRTSVCFLVGDMLAGSLDVYVAAPPAYDPAPAVATPAPDCTDVLALEQDPVSVLVEADEDVLHGGRTVCLGFGGSSVEVGVTLPAGAVPVAVYLTLDREKQATGAYCAARPEAPGCAGGFAEIQVV